MHQGIGAIVYNCVFKLQRLWTSGLVSGWFNRPTSYTFYNVLTALELLPYLEITLTFDIGIDLVHVMLTTTSSDLEGFND